MTSDRRSRRPTPLWQAILFGLAAIATVGCEDGDAERFTQAITVAREGLTELRLAPESLILSPGDSEQLSAIAKSNTGADLDVSDQVSWQSSDPSVVRVSSQGLVTALGDGTAFISARLAELTASLSVVASSAPLESIAIRVADGGVATVDVCKSLQLAADGLYQGEAAPRDITRRVNWSASDPASARFSLLDSQAGLLGTLAATTVTATASLNDIRSDAFSISISDTLTRIDVGPDNRDLAIDDSLQFTATGIYSDASRADITANAEWVSTNTNAASISNTDGSRGLAQGLATGVTTIVASCFNFDDQATLNVAPERQLLTLEIENGNNPIIITNGTTPAFRSLAVYADGSTENVTQEADWSASPISGFTIIVSNTAGTRGQVTTTGLGTSLLRVAFDGKVVTVPVEVR